MAGFPKNVRVFITGGGSGLGRALALKLAETHARILIGDINLASATETAELVTAKGGTAETLQCDVSKPEELEAAAAKMKALWGGTDLLINNAGVAAAGTVGDVKLEDWRWVVDINMWGMIYGCHSFIPDMRTQKSGWILNVASNAGLTTFPEMGPYNVSKAGAIALSETLRSELAPHNISVSVLCPTFFQTNLMSSFRSSDVRQRKLAEHLFKKANISADQVADIALRKLLKQKLIIIPQTDGKFMWMMKRLMPQTFYNVVGWGYGRSLRRSASR